MYLLNESRMTDRYGMSSSSSSGMFGGDIMSGATIVALIISFIVALVLFITIIQRKKALKGKFTKWLKEYLNFRSVLISGIIKFLYVFFATFTTIMGFVMMFTGRDDMVFPMILAGLAVIVFGNILLRILMEFTMALIVVWENTSDIRSVMVKKEENVPEAPRPEAPKPEAPKPKEPEERIATPVVSEKPVMGEQPVVEKDAESQKIEIQEPDTKSQI